MKGNSSKFLALLLSASMIMSPTVSVLADTQEKAAQTESSAAAEEAPQSEETAETAEPETTPAETESSESTAETPAEEPTETPAAPAEDQTPAGSDETETPSADEDASEDTAEDTAKDGEETADTTEKEPEAADETSQDAEKETPAKEETKDAVKENTSPAAEQPKTEVKETTQNEASNTAEKKETKAAEAAKPADGEYETSAEATGSMFRVISSSRIIGKSADNSSFRNFLLMNGNIKVESTLHKGTKITVTIYLELQEKEKEQDRNLMNLPVLVVDDDKTCCESTVATLKEIGITGEWVLSGREAVERCYAHHELKNDYFAVILDWKMPDMDGIETARQIRKRIGKEITIIVLTSYEFSEIEEEAKTAGVDAFIAKPLFRSRLTATLRQFTSGRKEKTARNYLDELSEADYTGKRILLVEDNELNREIAVEILQMTGAEVETAENGKIAVEKVEASPKGLYDLIFMDIQMPVMNGYEATAAIRSLPGEQGKLPIVAMTANAFAEDVQLAKNTGMNGHIAKPLDMNKLNDVLENWL